MQSRADPGDTSPKAFKKKTGGKGDFCCVPGCANQRGKDQLNGVKRSYHRIPTGKQSKVWVDAIRRDHWKPRPWDRVCSDHFKGGKRSMDPTSESYVPKLFVQEPKKRATANSQRVPITSPVKKKSKKRRSRKHLEASLGRPTAELKVITPHPISHDYITPEVDPNAEDDEKKLKAVFPEAIDLVREVERLRAENELLTKARLSLENLEKDNDMTVFWTGFPNFKMFEAVFNWLNVKAGSLNYWRGVNTSQTTRAGEAAPRGPSRALSTKEEFFLVMVRLKTGLMLQDLAQRFQISTGTVSCIFATWINFMFQELKLYFELPAPDLLKKERSEAFQKFPNSHMIIDCTEIFTETPSSLVQRKHTFSNYKHHQTFKFLVAISAHPAVVYVSRMYGGKASDMLITAESQDFLTASRLVGGRVMADRGFTGTYKMTPLGVEFLTPSFKGRDRTQLSAAEIQASERCSSARVHVERIMQRIKIYHILDGELKMTMKNIAEQIFTVCAFLTNFQNPILKE